MRSAASVCIPFLLVVPEDDSIAPVPAALEVASKAPQAELFRSAGGHYDATKAERDLQPSCERKWTSSDATPRPSPKIIPEASDG